MRATLPYALALFSLAAASHWLVPERFVDSLALAAAFGLAGLQLILDALFHRRFSRIHGTGSWGFALTIAPGTILHELSHAVMVWITRARLEKMSLFSPNPRSGVLGYVSYRMPADRFSALRRTVIGMAPYFGCGAALIGLIELVRPESVRWPVLEASHGLQAVMDLLGFLGAVIWQAPSSLAVKVIIGFFILTVALGAAPSAADFKSGHSEPLLKRALSFAAVIAVVVLLFALPLVPQLALQILGTTALAQVGALMMVEIYGGIWWAWSRL